MAAGDLIYGGYKADRIYRTTGLTSTIRDSLDTSGDATDPRGCTMDTDNNLIWTDDDYGSSKAWKKVGFSMTAGSDISSDGSDTRDCKWYATNLYIADVGVDKVYKHTGFTAPAASEVQLPTVSRDLTGMTLDSSGNLMVGDINSGYCYKYTGFSNTLSTSFAHGDGDPSGLDWYDGNLYSVDIYGDQCYKHTGFTATTTVNFNTATGDCAGLHYELAGAAAGRMQWKVNGGTMRGFINGGLAR